MEQHSTVQHRQPVLSWLACILGALFYCYASIIEIIPNNIVNQLIASFHLNATQVGILGTGYFTTYALCLIPGGLILDQWGERKTLSIAILICSLGTLVFALVSYFPAAFIARAASGIGGSFGLLGAMFLVSKWLPKQYFGLSIGCTIMIGLSGGLLQQPLELIIAALGWHTTLVLLSFAGFILAGLMYLVTRKLPPIINPGENLPRTKDLWRCCEQILRKPANWSLAIYGGLMFVPTGTLGTLWGISFLQVYYPSNSRPALAGINSLIFLGWIIGSPLLGWLSDYIKQRRLIVRFSSIGLMLALLAIVYIPQLNLTAMGILIFFIGICSAGGAMFFTMTADSNNATTVATALGFVNALALIPNILAQPIFGFMLDNYAANTSTRLPFSLAVYQHAFVLLFALLIVAIYISWFQLKETHPFARSTELAKKSTKHVNTN